MKKIPTLFQRSEDRRSVVPVLTSDCEWVLAGEGTATRKYDGTCVMFDGHDWWSRREVKPGKPEPAQFDPVDHDPVTGKTVGWEPIGQGSHHKAFIDALASQPYEPGTYELCGPKVNGNPEGYDSHRLVAHATAEGVPWADAIPSDPAMAHAFLASALRSDRDALGMEGIVWHHPDGRMVKLKARDFPQ